MLTGEKLLYFEVMKCVCVKITSVKTNSFQVPDLKRELKARGLSTSGNKNELIDRLQNSLKTKCEDAASVESADDLEEDLLNVSFTEVTDI